MEFIIALRLILKKEYKIKWITVRPVVPPGGMSWLYALPDDYSGSYFKTKQIRYGQKIKGFTYKSRNDPPEEHPLKELKQHVIYFIKIGTHRNRPYKILGEFTIFADNKTIAFRYYSKKLPKNRFVIIEKDGKKIAVPYTVNFIKNKEGEIEKKVITSHPERGRIIEDRD